MAKTFKDNSIIRLNMLSTNDKNNLMKRFPEIELSYENVLHKKVYTDGYFIIPKGKKFIAWFTYFKRQNVCLFLELNRVQNVCDISIKSVCFDSSLSLGTILYGTLFTHNGANFYSIENIHYYKGNDIDRLNEMKKLDLIKNMFKSDIKQLAYTNQSVIFSLPIICESYNNAMNMISSLPYAVYSIQFRSMKNTNNKFLNYIVKEKKKIEATFEVTPDIQNDIYNLFCKDRGDIVNHNIACIPDYKTSVMMNKIFRNIKENINLDALEESDDEEEFENVSEDKYLKVNKRVYMTCSYNRKFRKWQPISIADRKSTIITKKQLFNLEKIN